MGGFIAEADDHGPRYDPFWGGSGSYLDFTKNRTRRWWKEQLKKSLLDYGFESIWNDNNEFTIWDDESLCRAGPVGCLKPIQTLLMAQASFEAMREHQPSRRPFVISRSACPGVARYPQSWTGDNRSDWETLRYNIPMGLGLSLSAFPNYGHDVGGFCGTRPDPELFLRWIQNGIFHPRLTIHSWHSDDSVNEPWMYPEILPQVREALAFRKRIVPYFYSLLEQASRTGAPVVRPLVYEFPDYQPGWDESFLFLLGPGLLVASVLEPGQRQLDLSLPPGWWCDYSTGEWHQGQVCLEAPLELIPLVVREGAIISARSAKKEPELWLFPGPSDGSSTFTVYDDDGHSQAYLDGYYRRLNYQMRWTPEAVELSVENDEGSFPRPNYRLVLPEGETRPITAY